jgi:hypothetical protein
MFRFGDLIMVQDYVGFSWFHEYKIRCSKKPLYRLKVGERDSFISSWYFLVPGDTIIVRRKDIGQMVDETRYYTVELCGLPKAPKFPINGHRGMELHEYLDKYCSCEVTYHSIGYRQNGYHPDKR